MADPVLNTWGGLDLKLPPVLDEAKSDIQSVLSIISAALDVTLMVMDIAKTFSGGVLNPTRAIIQAVVNTLKTSIQDMRQMGIYLHYGDALLMRGDPTGTKILGGYSAYERRMIGRLLDQSDPGRPKFGNASSVFALFMYTAGDTSAYHRIFAFVKAIIKFFGQCISTGDALPIPAGVQFTYGIQGTSITNLMSMNPFQRSGGSTGAPDQINLTWSLAPPNSSDPVAVIPPIPPTGFMVEVSTIPEGLMAAWSAPVVSSTGGRNPDEQPVTSGFYVDSTTQEPVIIYGGMDTIHTVSGTGYNQSATATGFRPGAFPAYLLRSPADLNIIPIDLLQTKASEGTFLYGRAFYVHNNAGAFFTGGAYSATIQRDQLPYTADLRKLANGQYEVVPESLQLATTIYVRVYSIKAGVDATHPFQWNILPRRAAGDEGIEPYNAPGTADDKKISSGSRSQPSSTLTVNLPSTNAVTYLDCVRTALAVLVLSRSDLQASSVSSQTGLEGVSRDILNQMFSHGNVREWLTGNDSCNSFRRGLLNKITGVAQELILRQAIPEGLLAPRLAQFQSVTRWKWSDTTVDMEKRALPVMTIMESLQDRNYVSGLNQNFNSIGSLNAEQSQRITGINTFIEGISAPITGNAMAARAQSAGVTDQAEIDKLPLLVCMDISDEMIPINATQSIRRIWVARQVFDPTLLSTCQNILQIAATPQQAPGEWKYYRFFPTGMPWAEDLLVWVSQFCQRLADSTRAASDLISNFIDFYKQRVLELQNLILRIQGLVNQLDLLFDIIPTMKILVTTSRGTNGVVTDLMNAQSKPTDGKDAYAAGVVAIFGGGPSILADLIKAAVTTATT